MINNTSKYNIITSQLIENQTLIKQNAQKPKVKIT